MNHNATLFLIAAKLILICVLYLFPGGVIVCSCNGVPPTAPPPAIEER